MNNILDVSLIYATVRAATPILFAALCATITQQADILNIGTEGIMLTSAFVAVLTSFMTESWVLGIVAAMVSGIGIAMIMAVAHIKYNAHICAVGIAVNMFALAITKFGIKQFLGTSGTFSNPKIAAIPRIHIAVFDNIPILNAVFNNWCVTEVFGIIMVIVLWFLLFRTIWGLRLRCVGRLPMAAETAGINVRKMKYEVMVISGILGGLAGAHLSLGYSQMFAENITNGRGFMGVAAMNFGNMNPVFVWIGTLIFGFIDSMGARMQAYGLPSQFILMLPYIFTILVLVLAMWRKSLQEAKSKSSLKTE